MLQLPCEFDMAGLALLGMHSQQTYLLCTDLAGTAALLL
jgi:hypothetical protein